MNTYHNTPPTGQRSFRGTTVLLVEDNLDHQILIQSVLRACMPEVNLWMATTVEEALSQLTACVNARQPLPRLILLDIYLPSREMGFSLLQHLKEPTSSFRSVPVTLLSHSNKSDDIQTAYQLGANSYIVKPIDYPQWLTYFKSLHQYWLNTVTLPHLN